MNENRAYAKEQPGVQDYKSKISMSDMSEIILSKEISQENSERIKLKGKKKLRTNLSQLIVELIQICQNTITHFDIVFV